MQDHLGSVRVVLADGRPAAYNEYAPFRGSLRRHTVPDVFQGQRLARSTTGSVITEGGFPQPGFDLLDYGARLYDPSLPLERHRPAGREVALPVGLCLFRHNNPVIFVDPNARRFA